MRRLGGIQKYTKEELKKFGGNKPLIQFQNSYYPDKFLIEYHEFEEPKDFDLWEAIEGKRIELGDRKIIFGIEALEEDLVEYDFLDCPDGPAFVVHDRVLEILKRECASEFQELPVIIKNLKPDHKKFENKNFWLINLLCKRKCFDEKYIEFTKNGVPKFRKKVINNDCMKDCSICTDYHSGSRIIFTPRLARYFIKSRGVQFLTDEEEPIE